MNPEYLPYEQIDLYLQGLMSLEEKKEFELKLQEDPEFKNLFETQRDAYLIVEQYEFIKIKKELQPEFDFVEKKYATQQSKKSWWKISLTIVAAISLVGLIWNILDTETKNKTRNTTSRNSATADNKITNQNPGTLPKQTEGKVTINSGTGELPVSVHSPAIEDTANESGLTQVNVTENNETKSTEEVLPIRPRDKCDEVKLRPIYEITGSCFGQKNGSIWFKEILGGKAPYNIIINEQQATIGKLDQLAPGKYTIVVEDANECDATFEYSVPILECKRKLDFTFNPNIDMDWIYPLKEEFTSAQINIYNNNGNVLHRAEIENGIPESWNGIPSSGGVLESGYYLFILEYPDGSKEKGSLTILK